jgi:tRNA dimethylallyltransferase
VRIILLGPTAVGKTNLSLQLAQQLQAPIISVDSRQCYQYLNIGTAKPTFRELCQAPHYNISVLSPEEPDNVALFNDRATRWEHELTSTGKQHLLFVGGSTLHLQSLIKPLDDVPSANQENQDILERRAEQEGIQSLYKELENVDPDYAERMDGYNTQRIFRALDVFMQTGKPFSSFHTNWNEFTLPDDTLMIGLHRDRQVLYDRINRRAELMVEQGLVKEVEAILDLGYSPDLQALNTVGYKEIIRHLSGDLPLDKAIQEIQKKTRHYAKRQLTWFRRWSFINWLDMDQLSTDQACSKIQKLVAAEKNIR